MNEDFARKDWADNHTRFNRGIADGLRVITDALKVLNAKQFDAPWRHAAPQCDGDAC